MLDEAAVIKRLEGKRACDASTEFINVGEARGRVVGYTGCRWAIVPDGSCLIVLEGLADDVATAPESKEWRSLRGSLALPSGKLVVFDATAPRARTRETKTITLKPGRYTVEELDRNARRTRRRPTEPWLWMLRLRRSN